MLEPICCCNGYENDMIFDEQNNIWCCTVCGNKETMKEFLRNIRLQPKVKGFKCLKNQK